MYRAAAAAAVNIHPLARTFQGLVPVSLDAPPPKPKRKGKQVSQTRRNKQWLMLAFRFFFNTTRHVAMHQVPVDRQTLRSQSYDTVENLRCGAVRCCAVRF